VNQPTIAPSGQGHLLAGQPLGVPLAAAEVGCGWAQREVADGQAAPLPRGGARVGDEAVSLRPDLDPPPPRAATTRDPWWARTVDTALCLAWRLLWSWRR